MANKNWKARFTYKSKVFVEKTIDDKTFRFYPNRIALLEELADVSKPIGHAVATLFGKGGDASNSTHETFRDKVRKDVKSGIETADSAVDKITVSAPTPEVSEYHRKARDQAIDELIGAFTDKRNRILFGKLLMDSLREEFEFSKERDPAEVEEFLFGDGTEAWQGLDLPMTVQLCTGWLAANAKVFGDVGEKVIALVRGRLELPLSPSPSEETPSTVDGSSSKTPSSQPSEVDSTSVLSSSST
jgi:hypothetical protein